MKLNHRTKFIHSLFMIPGALCLNIVLLAGFDYAVFNTFEEKKPGDEEVVLHETPDPEDFTVFLGGDILIADKLQEELKKKGPDYPFKKISNELLNYDFVFANLETPVTERGTSHKRKPYVFRLSPELASCLDKIKLDVLSIANNHLMDYGTDGMQDTIDYLDKKGILHAGGGNDIFTARRPAVLRYKKTDIVFLAYCERPPLDFYAGKTKSGIAPVNLNMIKRDILQYKTDENVVLVSLHWGIEHCSIPCRYQKLIAHRIIDMGADGIVGHHPHWPQPVEVYKNKPIFYSLGNFINGFTNEIEKDNIGGVLYFRGNQLQKVEILSIAGKNRETKSVPYIHNGERAEENIGHLMVISRAFNTKIEFSKDRGIVKTDI